MFCIFLGSSEVPYSFLAFRTKLHFVQRLALRLLASGAVELPQHDGLCRGNKVCRCLHRSKQMKRERLLTQDVMKSM